MKIRLDMDGIVADFVGGVLNLLSTRPDDFNLTIDQVNNVDAMRRTGGPTVWWWSAQLGISPPAFNAICIRMIEEHDLFATLAPIPGAVDAVTALAEAHDLSFVTTPYGAKGTPWMRLGMTQKARWLHTVGLGHIPIVFARAKDELVGDVLIDDRPDNLIHWARTGRRAIALLTPYNDPETGDWPEPAPDLITWADDWPSIVDAL